MLLIYSQYNQIMCSILRSFPMFPYTHAQAISDMLIHFSTETFHASDFEVVNPSTDKLVEFLYFVAVAYAPTTTGEFFHSLLELCY